jgi:glutamyl-tRNA reductase
MVASKGSNIEQSNLVVLGSGEGTKLAALDFASRGQRVAVIERDILVALARTLPASLRRT